MMRFPRKVDCTSGLPVLFENKHAYILSDFQVNGLDREIAGDEIKAMNEAMGLIYRFETRRAPREGRRRNESKWKISALE